ncbi:MAG: TrgA family protein [Exiguobacterium profundum]|nr:MAG: TrgA family protein [Exiguobacterium profundum]
MPEGTQFGWFSEISAGIGFLCGWIVMGGLVGRATPRRWPRGCACR